MGKLIKLIVGVLVVLFLCLAIVAGAVYFWLWPLAQQHLASVGTVLQQQYAEAGEVLPNLPAEGLPIGLDDIPAVLPMLEQIGVEGLTKIRELAEAGLTAEEAQQALAILQEKLSAAELTRLQEMLQERLVTP